MPRACSRPYQALAKRARLAGAPDSGRTPMSASRTIPALLARAMAEFPGREAIVDGGLRWTFADLGEQVYRCAAAMIASGVQRGDRVAVWAPNGHRWGMAAPGAVTAGASLGPVHTRYKGRQAGPVLGKSAAPRVVVGNRFLGRGY